MREMMNWRHCRPPNGAWRRRFVSTLAHTHTHTHTRVRTCMYTRTHALSLSLSLSHTHTQLADSEAEVEELNRTLTQLRKKTVKQGQELNDLKLHLESQQARNEELEKRQRK